MRRACSARAEGSSAGLEAKAAAMDLGDSVEFLVSAPRERIMELLGQADVGGGRRSFTLESSISAASDSAPSGTRRKLCHWRLRSGIQSCSRQACL